MVKILSGLIWEGKQVQGQEIDIDVEYLEKYNIKYEVTGAKETKENKRLQTKSKVNPEVEQGT